MRLFLSTDINGGGVAALCFGLLFSNSQLLAPAGKEPPTFVVIFSDTCFEITDLSILNDVVQINRIFCLIQLNLSIYIQV
jgi:hypothetical protein